MRAQVSIEYLLITGFSFALIAPLLVLFASQSVEVQDQFQQSQAEQAVQAIAQSAQRVYYAGPPSKETLTIRVPARVEEFRISETSISMTFYSERNIKAGPDATLIPATLNPNQGIATITVQATNAGVLISD